MDASFYTDIPLAPGSDQTLRKQVTAFKLWDSGYTVAPPALHISPPGWADGLEFPQLVVKTLSPEGCV